MPKSGCGSVTSRPLICTVPRLADISPATILRKVVLPQPLGPSSVASRPAGRSNEMFSMATSGAWPVRANDWCTSLKWPNTVIARPTVGACRPPGNRFRVARSCSRCDRRRRQKAGGVNVGGSRRRAGQADILGNEIHVVLHLRRVEPAEPVFLGVGCDREIGDDLDLGDDGVRLEG